MWQNLSHTGHFSSTAMDSSSLSDSFCSVGRVELSLTLSPKPDKVLLNYPLSSPSNDLTTTLIA